MSKPKISVLMPVYNAEAYVEEAVNSILQQTFTDFEFIIIDDCSTDRSYEILKAFEDHRIRLYRNDKNLKISATLNKGIQLANGSYLARMDADDISRSRRLEMQYSFLENHPEIDMCGCAIQFFGLKSLIYQRPEYPDDVRDYSLYGTAFSHPSFMVSKRVYEKMKYDENYVGAEDYLLFSDLLQYYKGYNLKEVLLEYRVSGKQISYVANQDGSVDNSLNQKKLYHEIFKINLKRIHNNKVSHFPSIVEQYFTGEKTILPKDYNMFINYYNELKSLNIKQVYSNKVIKKLFVIRIMHSLRTVRKERGNLALIGSFTRFFSNTRNHKFLVLSKIIVELGIKFLKKDQKQ